MTAKPLIGLSLDYEDQGSFSQRPYYALRAQYFEAVKAFGGHPIALPLDVDLIDEQISLCDGILIPGGTFNFPTSWYAIRGLKDNTTVLSPRQRYDEILAHRLYDKKCPTLGICAGMQTMCGIFGGTFYHDVSSQLPTPFDHLNAKPAEQAAHDVEIFPSTFLSNILEAGVYSVNTAHREALVDCPKEVELCAKSPDGVIEAIAWKDHPFGLGVQWHPEFLIEGDRGPDAPIFKAFIEACKARQHA